MFILIIGLIISVVSMVFMFLNHNQSAWGWCGIIFGGYLILKGRAKSGLDKQKFE